MLVTSLFETIITRLCRQLAYLPSYYRKSQEGDLNLIISAHIITQTDNSIKNRLRNVISSKVVTLFEEKK